ncbi:hypothetical protein K493DRAFT_313514 [Basidiobolus meristosporus CBS 931.73]|uniref:Cyclin N-terminal domain-containing protein n=1 Tax=Basidiobolus meristosporus CBS 931.73 TaxID=1314790 RepID=A0A1Y1YL34_9FUNG|nr:hypothetical protein K493DRAFT_313514 [Basidiobolus meristosporus CBS 931.73]|eukprot:ORX98741.1 hypothetical protein K493DRAFT_313514 [Basidiobolus meristosporus CBS 931.73]
MLTYQASQHMQPHLLASQLAYYGQAPIQYFPASYYSYQSYQKSQENSLNNRSAADFADFVSQAAVQIWIGETEASFPAPVTLAKVPETFKHYTRHTLKAIQLSNSVSLIALKYVERLRRSCVTLKTSLSSKPQNILAIALILAAKYLDDSTYTSKTWSDLLSIPLSELNAMEFEFLDAISYNIHVSDKEYLDWLQSLIRLHVQQPSSLGQYSGFHPDQNPIASEKRKLEVSISSIANWEYMYSCYHYQPLMVQWYHHPSKPRAAYSPEYYMYESGGSYPYHGNAHNYSMHACSYGYV